MVRALPWLAVLAVILRRFESAMATERLSLVHLGQNQVPVTAWSSWLRRGSVVCLAAAPATATGLVAEARVSPLLPPLLSPLLSLLLSPPLSAASAQLSATAAAGLAAGARVAWLAAVPAPASARLSALADAGER